MNIVLDRFLVNIFTFRYSLRQNDTKCYQVEILKVQRMVESAKDDKVSDNTICFSDVLLMI